MAICRHHSDYHSDREKIPPLSWLRYEDAVVKIMAVNLYPDSSSSSYLRPAFQSSPPGCCGIYFKWCTHIGNYTVKQVYFLGQIKPRLITGCNNSKPRPPTTATLGSTLLAMHSTLWVMGHFCGASLTTTEKPPISRHCNFSLLVCIHISKGHLLILPLHFQLTNLKVLYHKTYHVFRAFIHTKSIMQSHQISLLRQSILLSITKKNLA